MKKPTNSAQSEIQIITEIAEKILTQSEEKYKRVSEISYSKSEDIRNGLSEYLKNEGHSTEKPNLKTYFKEIISNEKSLNSFHKPYRTFKILVKFLGVSILDNPDIKEEFTKIIVELKDKNIISLELANSQLEKIGVNKFEKWEYFYACYFSLGGETPDVSLLKIDADWKIVELEFFRSEHSIHVGEAKIIDNGSNIFITVTDKKNNFVSLLSLKPSKITPPKEAKRFNGYYCSALASDNGSPVAGKLIVEKINTESEAKLTAVSRIIKDEIKLELFNERLKYDIKYPIVKEHLTEYKGIYKGFWFLIKEDMQIRQIAFEIREDGTAQFREKGISQIQTGYVYQIDKTHHVIRIAFDKIDENSFRIQMIFDIKNTDKGYYDGVYSGQRHPRGKIMAGKIRIYNTDESFDAIESDGVLFEEATEKLIFEKSKSLIEFFWGDIGENESLIYPNIATFRNDYTYPIIESDEDIEDNNSDILAGNYVLFKLDSSKKRINRYFLHLDSKGAVTYNLNLNPPNLYLGTATIYESCLVFDVDIKDNKDYYATYIFWVAGMRRDDFKSIVGVYATLSELDNAPICGRAVLVKAEIEDADVKPIALRTDEYYELDKKYGGIMNLLTGVENNIIKTAHKPDKLTRNLHYGDIFFAFACYDNKGKEEKIKFLKMAFEHNFSKIELLEVELKKGLKSIQKIVKIENFDEKKKRFKITITGESEEWTHEVRRK